MGMAVDGLCHPAQACRGTHGVRSPVLPHHFYDRCPAGGAEAVAGTAETGRNPRPGAIPQQRDAAAAAQRSGGGAGAHPQEVPEMAGCAPGVPPASSFTVCGIPVPPTS